jgi:site-specific DNA-methyltransferase (adenine-specific)
VSDAEILDLRNERLLALDRKVDAAEGDGIYARWEFGRELLLERVGKQLPAGRLDEVAEDVGKSRTEIQYRVRFAERFAEGDEVRNAIAHFGSWYRVVNEALASTAHLSAEKNDWSTPDDLYAALDAEFGFTLDPCASDFNHKTPRYYTLVDDGLTQSWAGETVFMNPPYSAVDEWMGKAFTEGADGATVVALVPSRTDVGWFWDYARHGEVRFIRGRLYFVDDEGNTGPAPFPSAIVVFGPDRGGVRWWEP